MTAEGWVVLTFVGAFGLLIGSFLNAAIYRLPRECLSVIRQTRSRCPRCGLQLAWYDNIPVVSYVMLLRGRCRGCREKISWRYPLVELATAATFVALAWVDPGPQGLEAPQLHGGGWLVWGVRALLISALIVLSLVDWDFRILPDAITIPGIVVAPLLVALAPAVMPEPVLFTDTGWGPRTVAFTNGVAGAALGGGGLWLIGWLGEKAFRKPAMGFGDVKLSAGMGGILGVWYLAALIAACFIGSVVGLAVLAVKRDRYIPFGPFLAAGMVVTMMWGPGLHDALMDWLLRRC